MKAAIVLSLALAGLGLAVPTADFESEQDAEISNIFCIPKCKVEQLACNKLFPKDPERCELRYQQCKCKCKKQKWDPKKKTCV